jgi:hypothetical protein
MREAPKIRQGFKARATSYYHFSIYLSYVHTTNQSTVNLLIHNGITEQKRQCNLPYQTEMMPPLAISKYS